MVLSKQQIAQQLKSLGIQGSDDAGKLWRWAVENQHKIFPEQNCEVLDSNFFDTDHTRIYILRFVRKVERVANSPAWSFLGLVSSKKIPIRRKVEEVLLSVQLGSTNENVVSSKFPPIVTSESGLFIF